VRLAEGVDGYSDPATPLPISYAPEDRFPVPPGSASMVPAAGQCREPKTLIGGRCGGPASAQDKGRSSERPLCFLRLDVVPYSTQSVSLPTSVLPLYSMCEPTLPASSMPLAAWVM